MRALLLAPLAALVWPACAFAATPAFPLHTSGQYIVDSNGVRVHLNAFNWYGSESADFVVEGLEAQPLNSIVATIKGLGFNAVRLLWSNQMVESNPVVGNYALAANPNLEGQHALTIFDTVVNALTSAGIMVILDNHVSNAGWCCSTTDNNELWYNSSYPEANWIADWQALATRYQSNPGVIGVDLRNEPRSPATWGGNNANYDWHAAAQRGGNAVLTINPHLLIFVEGVSYAGDLSGVTSLPVQLNIANQLVYEAHDYGFWYSSIKGYSGWYNAIEPKWGYLVNGSNPQPLWIGEFGTCNSADTCDSSSSNADLGFWFNAMTSFVRDYGVDWSYWAINGTTESGNAGGFGTVEGYGVLNTSWNGSALASLTSRLESMMAPGTANFSMISGGTDLTLAPGGSGNVTVAIVPENGFTGTVNLSCAVTPPTGAIDAPTCSIPSAETVSSTTFVNATVGISTTGMVQVRNAPVSRPRSNPSRRISGAILACLGLLIGNLAPRGRKYIQLLLLLLLVAFPLAACGGGGAGNNTTTTTSGTSAGNYVVTVTGTASGLSAVTTQIVVTVN
ncbi:MAG TPA: glycoside hydrolase family 5 protein [Terracidiphilus sp.]|nr:glycoside hydrolase family 5 protein [Terracidiphilus sp.]